MEDNTIFPVLISKSNAKIIFLNFASAYKLELTIVDFEVSSNQSKFYIFSQ